MKKEFIQSEAAGPNGWTVWGVSGRIDITTAEDAYARGEEIVRKSGKTALDLSEVDYVSSAGIRVMMRLFDLAEDNGKEFTVVGAAGTVARVLKETGMDTLLQMQETVNDLP